MAEIPPEEMLAFSPLNTGGKEEVPEFRRKLFAKICAAASGRRSVIAVDGLRRVGKSVMLKQILNKMQGEGRAVFYYSFDKKAQQTTQALEDVAKFFCAKSKDAVICLDEVGKIEDWGGVIKKYYDRTAATFLISSSAALHIRKGKESLAGRMRNFTLPPLGFDEYLQLKGIGKAEKFDFSNPDSVTKHTEHLKGFMEKGSYPELMTEEDMNAVREYIGNSTIEKMIFEDIPSIFPVANPSKLLEIYKYFANYSGDYVHESTISNAVGIGQPAVGDYETYLEQSHLVKRVYTEANYAQSIRKKKKGYVASAAVYFNTTSQYSHGKHVENAVFEKLAQFSPRVYYDEQKREVDFIVGKEGKTAVEVKSGENVSASDVPGLVHYMKAKNLKNGFVVYNGPYDRLEKDGGTVHLLPLSTFLAADEIMLGKEG